MVKRRSTFSRFKHESAKVECSKSSLGAVSGLEQQSYNEETPVSLATRLGDCSQESGTNALALLMRLQPEQLRREVSDNPTLHDHLFSAIYQNYREFPSIALRVSQVEAIAINIRNRIGALPHIPEIMVVSSEERYRNASATDALISQRLKRGDIPQKPEIEDGNRKASSSGDMHTHHSIYGSSNYIKRLLSPTTTRFELSLDTRSLLPMFGVQGSLELFLEAWSLRLNTMQQALALPNAAEIFDPEGTDYAAGLGAALVCGVAGTIKDWASINPQSSASTDCTILSWSTVQAQACCTLLRRNAIIPLAMPAGISATVRCILAFSSQVSALTEMGLQLSSTILYNFTDELLHILSQCFRRLAEAASQAARVELDATSSGFLMTSANALVQQVETIVMELSPLVMPQITLGVEKGIESVFAAYTTTLGEGLGRLFTNNDGGAVYRSTAEVCMKECAALAEVHLPQAIERISDPWRVRIGLESRLRKILEQMGISLGMKVVD